MSSLIHVHFPDDADTDYELYGFYRIPNGIYEVHSTKGLGIPFILVPLDKADEQWQVPLKNLASWIYTHVDSEAAELWRLLSE